jgi:hypothetical protein
MTCAAVDELLKRLDACGAWLDVEGEDIRCRAPKGALSQELIDALRASKSELKAVMEGSRQLAGHRITPHARPPSLKRPLGQQHANCLATKFPRPAIAAILNELQQRAAEAPASRIFAQLVADWTEILAAKDGAGHGAGGA